MSRKFRSKREGRSLLPAFCVLAWGVAACAPSAATTAYTGATVFDGTDTPPIRDAVIVVTRGRITQVGPAGAVSIPRRARRVALDGKWVIPGLVDAHVHVERWALSRYLAYGVTTVRDVGGDTDSLVALRSEIASGATLGPRLFISGAMIDGKPATWPGVHELAGPADAAPVVARLADAGVSQIKVYTHATRPILEAVVSEARARRLPVTAHLGLVDALTAARLGVRSIEHLSGVVEATTRDPAPFFAAHGRRFFDGWKAFLGGWAALDSAALEKTAQLLAETDVFMVATLVQSETYTRLDDPANAHALDLSGVPADVQAAWNLPDLLKRAAITPAQFAAFRRSRPKEDLFIRRFHFWGGRIVTGSDSPNQLLAPGASLHDELKLLVSAGLPPTRALFGATRWAAQLLGADSLGILTPGAVADFVVLSADPLDDIGNVSGVEQVVVAGRRYSSEELRRGW